MNIEELKALAESAKHSISQGHKRYQAEAGFKDALTHETILELIAQLEALKKAISEAEPFGRVTIVRRPGCADQYWFYPWPDSPYLDNAAELHTLYTLKGIK